METKTTFTKAHISKEQLINLFGIEFGFIDCSIHSLEDLQQAVDNTYSEQQIHNLVLNPTL